jgi:hypothetical protein
LGLGGNAVWNRDSNRFDLEAEPYKGQQWIVKLVDLDGDKPKVAGHIERLNEEFRRRVKTQGALPTEDAALVLLFGLVVSGQIRLRRLDGWRQIPAVLRERRRAVA